MKKKYDFVFVTNCPAFYKINLFNEIARKAQIMVVFVGVSKEVVIDENFSSMVCFDYIQLSKIAVEKRNRLKILKQLFDIIRLLKYQYIIYDGYELIEFIFMMFVTHKEKNCLICESSINESRTTGMIGFIKKAIFKRISVAFPCGELHAKIFKELDFKGRIVKTFGVGIFNKLPKRGYEKKNPLSYKYLYVGRLVAVKNIELLIHVFNKNGRELTIVGTGELEAELKTMANSNITFYVLFPISKLPQVYEHHVIFILPSKSETWGLVVEEAIYNGLPVIVSDAVGCYIEMVKLPKTGIVFKNESQTGLEEALECIENNFQFYRNNVMNYSFEYRDNMQVCSYLSLL